MGHQCYLSEGSEALFQVETGLADRAGEVQQLIAENSNIHYVVSTEIYNRIHDSALDTLNRITDIGSNDALVQRIKDGLETPSIDDKLARAMKWPSGNYEGHFTNIGKKCYSAAEMPQWILKQSQRQIC